MSSRLLEKPLPFKEKGAVPLLSLKRQEGLSLSVYRTMPGSWGSRGDIVPRHCPKLDQVVPVAFLSYQSGERVFPRPYLIKLSLTIQDKNDKYRDRVVTKL